MKCDELKAYTYDDMLDGNADVDIEYYPKSEVDAAIAELKEVAEDACLERDDNSRVIDELEAENRKLKRALWLARAERSASWQIHFSLCHNHSIEREFSINGASMPCEEMATMRTAKDWAMIWKKVERLCLKKAEEYK